MNYKKLLVKLADSEDYLNKKHPITCQFLVNFVSGLSVAFIAAIWVVNTVPPKPVINNERLSPDLSKVTIKNEGLFPSNAMFNIAPGSGVTAPIVRAGNMHAEVRPAANDMYKIYLKDLPRNQVVAVDFNSGNVKVEK